LQELFAGFGEDGFRMELDAFDFVAAVPEAHDDAVFGFGGDGELAGQRFSFDNERVIARGGKRVRQFAENVFPIVMDLAGFAVEKFWSTNDFPAEGRADGLMAEANAENGKFSGKPLDELDRDASLLGSARAGRNDDALGFAAGNFFDSDFVVAMDFDSATQFAKILSQVVSERIVVV